MSCRELHPGVRWLVAATLVLSAGGCAAGAAGSSAAGSAEVTAAGVPADDRTRVLAEVETARQCAVSSLTFPDEAGITADLDTRLAAVGRTHAEWKDWHDALAGSPELVAQLAEVGRAGCAGA